MSYGDNAAQMRHALTWLLEQDQPPTTDPATLARYRDTVLAYCTQAAAAATGTVPIGPVTRPARRQIPPGVLLRDQLVTTRAGLNDAGELLPLLATRHRNPYLRHWQAAAKAGVAAEPELAEIDRLATADQRWTLAKDAADTVRALAGLDALYTHQVPGYQQLPGREQLTAAAVTVSAMADQGPLDYRIDHTTAQQPLRAVPVTGDGITGAAQAQHNCAVHLARPPSARNLRQILLNQLRVSTAAADTATTVGHDTAGYFSRRAEGYRRLVAEADNIDGLLGARTPAVTDSAHAAALATTARSSPTPDTRGLRALARASRTLDTRINTAIDTGTGLHLYAVPGPHVRLRRAHAGIHRAEPNWRPADRLDTLPLRDAARQLTSGIQPATKAPSPPLPTRRHQHAYEALLADHGHRPDHPGLSL